MKLQTLLPDRIVAATTLTFTAAALIAVMLMLPSTASAAGCPYLMGVGGGRIKNDRKAPPHPLRRSRRLAEADDLEDGPILPVNRNERSGDGGIPDGGFDAVRNDIAAALTDSQSFWPADFGNYGPLMIRLSWHCAGSYRESDGRGGCDGGRIRFDPELTWPDNGNLDKALEILRPIKDKYGSKLSWGDLIVLAGDTAIETMGGQTIGFCGGRIDDADGIQSLPLGPSEYQQALMPCGNGDVMTPGCESPLGQAVLGLIYVNPEGPEGYKGDPEASATAIRDVFGRMGFDDRGTVALIGGGHAFGKAHGACPNPPCGDGIGPNTFTSGIEGPWTTKPTNWTNEFFENLFEYNWTNITGPGGKLQWMPEGPDAPEGIMMLTTDIALSVDPSYRNISLEYESNLTAITSDFAAAWYQLMTRDMGPRERCLGDDLPPVQDWENALPPAAGTGTGTGTGTGDLPDYVSVRSKIQDLIDYDPDNNIPAFVRLAMGCANTFQETNYRGGCNGAKIRFEPELGWETNAGAADAIDTLSTVKDAYPVVTYADLIVLAGQTAVEAAGGIPMPFCGGRVDALDAAGSEHLAPRTYATGYLTVKDDMLVKGLSLREGVALFAAPAKDGTTVLSNQYFIDLLAGNGMYNDKEMALLEGEFAAVVNLYAANNEIFLSEFTSAWTYMMTADRFDGPLGNACDGVDTPTLLPALESGETTPNTLLPLRETCNADEECETGLLCTGVPGKEKKCLVCARKRHMCTYSTDCCQTDTGRYCNNKGQCAKCPNGMCPY